MEVSENGIVLDKSIAEEYLANLLQKITRIEVIDNNGRVYSKWNINADIYLQEDNRTMKIFVTERKDNK